VDLHKQISQTDQGQI